MSANSICQKLQLAARDYLRAEVTDGGITLLGASSILAGIETGSLPLPRVVCISKRATVEDFYDGNWTADLTIRVVADAADTDETAFHLLLGDVFSRFFISPDALTVSLSNSSLEFTAFAVYPRSQEWDLLAGVNGNDSGWVAELVVTVKCCGSVVE